MKKILSLIFLLSFAYGQSGIRSLNGSLLNSQRLTFAYDDTASYFRWSVSNGVHTLYIPYNLSPTIDTGGISSLNGLNTSSQVFAYDTTSNLSPYVSSSGSTHTWHFPMARVNNKLNSVDTTAFRTWSDTLYGRKRSNNIWSAPQYFTARDYHTSIAVDTIDDKSGGGIDITSSATFFDSVGVYSNRSPGFRSNSSGGIAISAISSAGVALFGFSSFSYGVSASSSASYGVYGLQNGGTYPRYGIYADGNSYTKDTARIGRIELTNPIDTTYLNAIATATSKTGLITITRYNSKDLQFDLDTTGATGLRSKYVPYSGANTSVNLGAQTFTTTGAGSFGAGNFSSTVTSTSTASSTGHFRAYRNQFGMGGGSGTGTYAFSALSGGNTMSDYARIFATVPDTTAGAYDGIFAIGVAVDGTVRTIASFKNDSALYLSTALPATSGTGRMYAGSYYTGSTLTIDASRNATLGTGTFSGDVISSQTTHAYRSNTASGANTKRIFLAGGGSISTAQGAYIGVYGSQYPDADSGQILINPAQAQGNYRAVKFAGNAYPASTGTWNLGGATTDVNLEWDSLFVQDISASADIAVNGGDLTSSATTFNLLNATVTTGNLFGAGTTVSIGASTGKTTINNPNLVLPNATTATTPTTFSVFHGDTIKEWNNAWGEIWITDTATVALTLTTADVFYSVKSTDDGVSSNVIIGDSSITVTYAGTYKITMTLSGENDQVAVTTQCALFVDDVIEKRNESDYYDLAGNATTVISWDGIRQFDAGDVLKVKIKSSKAGTFTLEHFNFNIHRIN